jgi:hypothetical protein
MENSSATKYFIEKMFRAAVKQRFFEFARKYNRKLVSRIWAQIAKSDGIELYLSRWDWERPEKIVDALDSLDEYCDSLEALIREGNRREKGKRKIFGRLNS